MARSEKQKLKLLYIIKILSEQTDEDHFMQTQRLIEELENFGIKAERKTIYSDVALLQEFGYDIISNKARINGGYAMAGREFELPELKLLVDAVQASKFITIKKSRELIAKIEGLVSRQQARQLQRQVYVSNRIKAGNESIYINVDYLHRAIQENVKIRFRYFEWTVDKQMRFRKEGEDYVVSPFSLTFSEENYYLIAYDAPEQKIKHYRVDKMTEIRLTEDSREGSEEFGQFDLADYSNKIFGMFGGREETVGMQFTNRLIGVVIDRFGKDISIRTRDDEHFSVRAKVALSGQFYGWLAGLGQDARIISPTYVAEEFTDYLGGILWNYK